VLFVCIGNNLFSIIFLLIFHYLEKVFLPMIMLFYFVEYSLCLHFRFSILFNGLCPIIMLIKLVYISP